MQVTLKLHSDFHHRIPLQKFASPQTRAPNLWVDRKTATRNVTFRNRNSVPLWITRSYVICGTRVFVEMSTMFYNFISVSRNRPIDRMRGCFQKFHIECMDRKKPSYLFDQTNLHLKQSRISFARCAGIYKLIIAFSGKNNQSNFYLLIWNDFLYSEIALNGWEFSQQIQPSVGLCLWTT